VYPVSQSLTSLNAVDSAEPNHIVVRLEGPARPKLPSKLSPGSPGDP